MRRFELIEPRSLAEDCAILTNIGDGTKVVVGGTALLTIIKRGLAKILVNLKKIRDASEITFDPQHGLCIGAPTTINEIETSLLC